MSQPLALPNYSAASRYEDGMDRFEFETALEKAGWDYCGSGAECTVLKAPNNARVVKLLRGHGDEGQHATIDAAFRLPDNPHLPTIYGDGLIVGDGFEGFETEYLEEARRSDAVDTFKSSTGLWSGQRRVTPEDLAYFGELPDGPAKEALLALTEAALDREDRPRWDCHSHNLMVRPSDGAVVLNDPFYA